MADNIFKRAFRPFNPFGRNLTENELKKDLRRFISPVTFNREKTDVGTYRDSTRESENAWYPHRVKQQRVYIDTVINGQVTACMGKRRDLTLLRRCEFVDSKGNVNEKVSDYFQSATVGVRQNKKWFQSLLSYSLDSTAFGYSLISLGNVENDSFKKVSLIKRWNISPDRLMVNSLVYSLSGEKFLEEPYRDWHIYVDTDNELGTSECGYGYLYKIALLEIHLRNILAFNANFVELFATPLKVGKTSKADEFRIELRDTLIEMGNNGVAVIDPQDEIEFIESKNSGSAFESYANFEKRLEAKISKIILGHADAIDSVPGKLGNSNKKSPSEIALQDKQTNDGQLLETVINDELLPRMRNIGFVIPDDVRFRFKNDAEIEEINNNVIAQAVQIKKAGLQMDSDYFTEKTGIKVSAEVKPTTTLTNSVKNKLEKLYGKTEKCNCGGVH